MVRQAPRTSLPLSIPTEDAHLTVDASSTEQSEQRGWLEPNREDRLAPSTCPPATTYPAKYPGPPVSQQNLPCPPPPLLFCRVTERCRFPVLYRQAGTSPQRQTASLRQVHQWWFPQPPSVHQRRAGEETVGSRRRKDITKTTARLSVYFMLGLSG